MEKDIFGNLERTVYTMKKGYKQPFSNWDKDDDYYDKYEAISYDRENFIRMLKFKNRMVATMDKRWKSARQVIDLVAKEVGIDPEKTHLYLYAVNLDDETPIVQEIRKWSDSSGDKVKLKKRVAELETQVEALKSLLKGN